MATGTMDDKTSTTQMLLNTQLKNSTQTITLSTAKKYIKKDIKINITTQAAKTAAGVAVGNTVIYTGTSDTDINPNLLLKTNDLTTWNKESKVTVSSSDAEGYYTINVASDASTTRWGIYQDLTNLKTNTDYTITAEGKGAVCQLSVCFGTDNVNWGTNVHVYTASGDKFSYTFNTGTSAKARIYLNLNHAAGGNISGKFKSVKLEEGMAATAWVPNSADTGIVNLGSKVTLTSETGSKYYIPLKTTGSGYTEVTQKGWIEAGNKDRAEVINTNYINIPEATFQNVTVTTNTSKVQLVSAEGYTEGKYISALTVPAKKTLDTLTLTAGDSSGRTYLSTLNVNGYTTVSSISLSGIITTITATGGGYIGTANLNNANSYIGNVYGTGYIRTNSGSTLAKYTQNGTLTTYEGSGGITNYSNTGTITNMTGSRTITNLGTSSTAGTLNITTNTYGTINVWGGKTKDKGVTIANHVVIVDGDGTNAGTAVTDSNGDLITGTLANSATANVTYAENTSVAIPSQGALYINAGYYPNTMITLDQMLDGKTDTAGTANGQILSGYVAYDVDGKKLTGTIPVINGNTQDALSVGWSSLSTKSGKLYIGMPGDTYYKKADSAAYIYVSPSQLPQAVFASNITTASSGGVPLVSTAGYTGTKNLTAVTIAAGKTLGSASAAGVTLSAKDSSNNISQMYVTMNTGSKIYLKDANSEKTWIIESDDTNNSLNIWQE